MHANGSRHLAGLHLLVGIDKKVIETLNANQSEPRADKPDF